MRKLLEGNRSKFSTGATALSLAAVFSLLNPFTPMVGAQEELLKPDVPQMDQSKPAARVPLKGGVEHNQNVKPDKKKKLKAIVKQQPWNMRAQNGSLDNNRLNSSLDNTQLQSQAERSFGVIGVRFVAMTGYPPVINTVFPNTPAAEVGLANNDLIMAVDGVPTAGLSKDECYDLIIGTPNTPVTLSLRRGNQFFVRTMNRIDVNELTDNRVKRAYMFHL